MNSASAQVYWKGTHELNGDAYVMSDVILDWDAFNKDFEIVVNNNSTFIFYGKVSCKPGFPYKFIKKETAE